MLTIDPKELPIPQLHGYLLGAVGPRPIAFASTIDEEGNPKLDLEGNEITTEKVNDVPFLLDADKQPMDVVVGNGSKGGVQVKSYPNKYGLQLELQGVMITDLVEYNPDENEIQF